MNAAIDTTLVLVRHGETEWNRQGRIQGHTDSNLTSIGIDQAEAIAVRLAAEAFDRLVSSDLGRAHHTARLIAKHVALEVYTDAHFRERGFGIAEGKTYAEIDREFPGMFSRIRDAAPEFAAPGRESLRQFHERVSSILNKYAVMHAGKSVLVVTHGGVLGAIYRWLTDLPIASRHKIDIPNAGYNRLRHDGNTWRIENWGDVAHLPQRTDSEGI
jgi:probable phosphoglycerate mutase